MGLLHKYFNRKGYLVFKESACAPNTPPPLRYCINNCFYENKKITGRLMKREEVYLKKETEDGGKIHFFKAPISLNT